MDEFGVLTERFGLKPQGKSAPMASSKRPANFGVGSGLNPKSPPYSSRSNSNSDYRFFHSGSDGFPDDIFGAPIKPTKQPGISGFDFDSMFSGSKSTSFSSSNDAYDVFDVMPGLKGSASAENIAKDDDFFGSIASVQKHSAPADDLLGDLSGAREKLQTLNVEHDKNVDKSGKAGKNADDVDDLIPGFGESTPSNNGTHEQKSSDRDRQSTVHSTKTNYGSSLEQDPFVVLDAVSTSTSTPAYDFTVLEQISKLGNSQGVKLGGSPDSFRKLKSPQSPAQVSKVYPVVDAQTNNRRGPKPQNPSPTPIFDDLFFPTDGASPEPEKFQEVEGESEKSRRARLASHQRIQERQSEAVAEMNRRDRQIQQEQEEKCRIAETLDNKIKSWSYGKEGNMRALLSSLHCVLWPESGWVPVSLTDLIASRNVKKVYMKARLCVHPDKVQQKGVEQKYTAEKVFYILQEGWNKFQKEELS